MKKILLVMVLTAVMSSCGLTKKQLGLERSVPDETAVQTRQPLDIPPDFDELPE